MVRPVLLLLVAATFGATAFLDQTAERVDLDAIQKIRDEGFNRSQVMDTAFWLTDRYGPRLDASPEFEEAGEWTLARLRAAGLSNVRKERYPAAAGWSLTGFHLTMTAPRVMPVIAIPHAWSAPTPGLVSAEVVRPVVSTRADLERYRGQLRGKVVLTQPERIVRMLEHGDGPVLRYDDQGDRWAAEVMATPGAERPLAPPAGRAVPALDLAAFYRAEGVAALFEYGDPEDLSPGGSGLSWQTQRVDGGTVVAQARADMRGVPQVTLAVEHYNRMVRLVDHGERVRVELRIDAHATPGAESFNIVAEIPGTDRSDEVVLLGAHFDSWHGGTGATDNAAGVSAMIEATRLITSLGHSPRRTIRLALWGGEEQGFAGSRAYARQHLGTRAAPRPGLATTSAYFNLDNGTGRIRGIWTQGNHEARSLFETWRAPLADLGVDLISPRSVQQTDHVTFDSLGVPAFQFVQERYEYNSRTHHTNMDVYDRLQPDDLKQMAVVVAAFAWLAANRDAPLPRRTTAGAPGQ